MGQINTFTLALDTNIVIPYLDKDPAVIERLTQWRELGVMFLLPAMVEAEVLAFRGYADAERTDAEVFLEGNFLFVPFDREITRTAATIRRTTNLKLPDAAIAATAIAWRAPLVTRNVHDFEKIPGLHILTT